MCLLHKRNIWEPPFDTSRHSASLSSSARTPFSLETAVGRAQVGLNWRVQLGETRQRPLGRNEEQRRCAWQGRPNWVCSVVTQWVNQLEAKNMSKIKCL